jgi:putative DNA primase/helicase
MIDHVRTVDDLDLEFAEILEEVAQRLPDPRKGNVNCYIEESGAGLEPFRPTDLWNARLFVHLHGSHVRYCERLGGWFHYGRNRWVRAECGEVDRLAKETVRHLYGLAATEADETRRREMAKHATRSEAAGKIGAMLDLAKTEEGIVVAPETFDADPWLLSAENGTVDLRTGVAREHQPGDLLINIAGASIGHDPHPITWERFLRDATGGDLELQGFLRRFAGYSATGITREQCLVFLYGPEAAGKSTFLRAIDAALGSYARTAEIATFLLSRREAIRNDLAALAGARAVFATEPEEGQTWDEGLIKLLTGEDRIRARFLFRESFEFGPTFKLWIAGNHRPRVRSSGGALWRRVHVVPFTRTVPEKQRDPHLFEKLREELPGILAWIIEGCLEWQRDGLRPPASVRAATAEYRTAEDALAPFIEDCCIVEPQAKSSAGDLYKGYSAWCGANGERPIGKRGFGLRLDEKGLDSCRGTRGTRYWLGIRLRSDTGDA